MTIPSYPFVGLRPFESHESELFCGRDIQIEYLKKRLPQNADPQSANEMHFIAVLGVSGSGKSSLVKAGLLPRLRGDVQWQIAEFRPGAAPYTALSEALLKDSDAALCKAYKASLTIDIEDSLLSEFLEGDLRHGSRSLHQLLALLTTPGDTSCRYLLVVDQFEELFRYMDDALREDALGFVNLLLTAATHSQIWVLITMRTEYLEQCSQFTGLPEAINSGLYMLPRLTEKELIETIKKPLEKVSDSPYTNIRYTITETLVQYLLNGMSELPTLDERDYIPDRLPLLQHALYRVWGQACSNLAVPAVPADAVSTNIELTEADYEAIHTLSADRILQGSGNQSQVDSLKAYLDDLEEHHDVGNNPLQEALIQHLEELFYDFKPDEQKYVEKIFSALVEYDSINQRLVRRVCSFENICALFSGDQSIIASELIAILYHTYVIIKNLILNKATQQE